MTNNTEIMRLARAWVSAERAIGWARTADEGTEARMTAARAEDAFAAAVERMPSGKRNEAIEAAGKAACPHCADGVPLRDGKVHIVDAGVWPDGEPIGNNIFLCRAIAVYALKRTGET